MTSKSRFSIVVPAVLATAVFLFSCATEGFKELSQADIQKIDTSMDQAFANFDTQTPPDGVTVDEVGNVITITWTDFSDTDVVVSGTLDITVTNSTATTGTAELDGTLSFTGTGAVVEELVFDIAVDFELKLLNPQNSTFEVSGTVGIDGEEFDAENLTNEDLIYDIMIAFLSP
jgi:hypothetical protein